MKVAFPKIRVGGIGVAQRTLVLSDIHGTFYETQDALDKAAYVDGDRIIPLGDIVDGGAYSPETVQLLMNLGARPLLGNHEFDHIRQASLPKDEQSYSRTKLATIQQFKDAYLKRRISITYQDAIDWFKTFPLYYNLPEALLVHYGVHYNLDLNHPLQRKIMLGLGMSKKRGGLPEWADDYPLDAKAIFSGHRSIFEEIRRWNLPVRKNLYLTDMKAVRGGFLTVVSLPDFTVYNVPARRETRNYMCEAAHA